MILGPVAQIVAFSLCALIAIAGALGMATTMSMFRSGIFLMASFIGVAGLFILLSADLLGLLQVMMYIGGMLVMILFMVLFSHDPGGAMMAGMQLPIIEKFFSLGLLPREQQQAEHDQDKQSGHAGNDHQQMEQNGHSDHTGHVEHGEQDAQHGHDEHAGQNGQGGHEDHEHMDMSMTTPIKKPAAILATLVGLLLVGLLLLRPAWPIVTATPNPNSAEMVGRLLMGKYMLAFEGAGLLILIGIFGAVFLARAGHFPDESGREARVAVDAQPTAPEAPTLQPVAEAEPPDAAELVGVTEVQTRRNLEKDGRGEQ
jgi:NADH-quinone oxidoreductase subunit J